MVVQTGITHAAAVEVDGVVQQRAIAVWSGLQFLEKLGEKFNMVGAYLGDLLNLHRVISMVTGGVVRLRYADLRISTITEFAGELKADNPGNVGLQRQ